MHSQFIGKTQHNKLLNWIVRFISLSCGFCASCKFNLTAAFVISFFCTGMWDRRDLRLLLDWLSSNAHRTRVNLTCEAIRFFNRDNPSSRTMALESTQPLMEIFTPWSESASELYRPSDRRLSAKRLPTCADRGCQAVSVTDPYSRILGF
jgi:hypothetical protein